MSVEPASALHVVVPVLNEAKNLDRLFASFRALRDTFGGEYRVAFLMVDDGSTDGTGDRSRQLAQTLGLDLVLLRHAANRGPGHAFGTAFEYLAPVLHDHDWVLTVEGDNTSRIELLRQMFTRTREGYDVVLASPYMYGGGIINTTPLRVILSQVANTFVKETLDLSGFVTISSFFRLYRGRTLGRLQAYYGPRILERKGFESMIEMLLKLAYLQTPISEVAMTLDASQRAGKSKMKILRTIWGYLTLWRDKGRWKTHQARMSSAGALPLPPDGVQNENQESA